MAEHCFLTISRYGLDDEALNRRFPSFNSRDFTSLLLAHTNIVSVHVSLLEGNNVEVERYLFDVRVGTYRRWYRENHCFQEYEKEIYLTDECYQGFLLAILSHLHLLSLLDEPEVNDG